MLALQRDLAAERLSDRSGSDLLLLVEHDPVLTIGRGSQASDLIVDRDWLERRGMEVVVVERGGDITFHGPGQLVGYPVFDLAAHRRDLHWYLRRLEEALLQGTAACGLTGGCRVEGHTGIWRAAAGVLPDAVQRGSQANGFPTVGATAAGPAVREHRLRKLASIGVHVSRWITRHGFALNVTDEPLAAFEAIVPCGIPGVAMTSLRSEGVEASPDQIRREVVRGVAKAFGFAQTASTSGRTAGPG